MIGLMLGRKPGNQRCGAIGLEKGDCQQSARRGHVYCNYHEKLSLGLMEPSAPIYPVWPLPPFGYVLIKERNNVGIR